MYRQPLHHYNWVCRFLGPVVGVAFTSPRVQDARRYLPPSSSSSVRLEEEALWDFQGFWALVRPRQSSLFEVPIEIFSVFFSPFDFRLCMVPHKTRQHGNQAAWFYMFILLCKKTKQSSFDLPTISYFVGGLYKFDIKAFQLQNMVQTTGIDSGLEISVLSFIFQ